MAIIPFLVGNMLNDQLSNQRLGFGLHDDDFLEPTLASLLHHKCYRPHKSTFSNVDRDSTIVADKNKFQVSLDVQQFAPNEIQVKAIDDNHIVVEGKHEEKKDEHGYISRQFTRRYVLPEGYDGKNIASHLSSDGVLTISAPKLAIEGNGNERTIPITQTGPMKKSTIEPPKQQ